MNTNTPASQPSEPSADLATRLFNRSGFAIAWLIFLAVIVTKVAWPLRNIALVVWVYGSNAYLREGVRVLPGKPLRFSNGEPVPQFPDFATGMLAFVIFAFGLSFLLIWVLRLYERLSKRRKGYRL